MVTVLRCRFEAAQDTVSLLRSFIVLPDCKFMVFWNVMLILMTFWTGFAVPFQAAFKDVPWMGSVDILCDIVFIVDVCINFRLAYYKGIGSLELDSRKIVRRYLRTWFLLDLAGSIPLDWFVPSSEEHIHLVVMLRLCKFVRFGRLVKLVAYLKFSSLGGIFQLYAVIFMVTHWLACMYEVNFVIAFISIRVMCFPGCCIQMVCS
jgi:hypothetical protein